MSALDYVKAHPYQIAGGVFVVGIVLVLTLKSKSAVAQPSSVTVSGYDPGYNASVVAANSSMYSAGLAVQAHAADVQAALSAHLDDNSLASNIAAAKIAAGTNAVNVAANVEGVATAAGVTTAGINSSTLLGLGGLQNNHDLGLAQIASNTTLGVAGINGQVTLGAAKFATDTALGTAQISSNTALGMGQIAFDTNVVSTNGAIAGMQLTNQHDIGIAQIGRDVAFSANSVAMNASNNGVILGLAQTQANAETNLAATNAEKTLGLAQTAANLNLGMGSIAARTAADNNATNIAAMGITKDGILGTQVNALGFTQAVYADQAQARDSNREQEIAEMAARSTDLAARLKAGQG